MSKKPAAPAPARPPILNEDELQPLRAEAYRLTEEWLSEASTMRYKWGDIRAEHRQAAHERVQRDLHKFDPSKGSFRAFVRARAAYGVQDASRRDAQGLIGCTEAGRGKSMPVMRSAGTPGDGGSILDYAPSDAPGRDCDPDSPLAPIFDAQPVTRTSDESNIKKRPYDDNYRIAPAAKRRYHFEERVFRDSDHRTDKERFLEFGERNRLSPYQAEAFLSDPDNLREFTHPVSVPNDQPAPEIVAVPTDEQRTVREAVTTAFRQIKNRRHEPWYLLTNAFYDRYRPGAKAWARNAFQRALIEAKRIQNIPRAAFDAWVRDFEKAAAVSDRVRQDHKEKGSQRTD